jgi:hypothetical protein
MAIRVSDLIRELSSDTYSRCISVYEVQAFLIEMVQGFRFDLPDSKPKVRYVECLVSSEEDVDVLSYLTQEDFRSCYGSSSRRR